MASPQSEGFLKPTATVSSTRSAPAKSRPRSLYERYVSDWWLLESLSVLLGLVAILGLCLVLRHYDQNLAPRINTVFGRNVTLNTLVSILSTIGRAALLYSVCECIGQLKWSWYLHSRRSLEDLDVFDEASRGAWGGLKLLWKVNVRQIASIGALLVVGGLAVDPLSQQLVHFKDKLKRDPSGSASLQFATHWTASSRRTNAFVGEIKNPAKPQPPLAMKGAIQSGVFSQLTVIPDLEPTCTRANCTWPSYRSLAICARSKDVTSSLKTKTVRAPRTGAGQGTGTVPQWYLSEHNYIVDDGVALANLSSVARNITEEDATIPSPLDFADSIAFKDSPLPLADVFLIYLNTIGPDGQNSNFSAIEFVLEWCVQNFTTVVINGTATTKRHEINRAFPRLDPDAPDTIPTVTPNDGDNRVYSVFPSDHVLLQTYFQDLFNGNVNSLNERNAYLWATNDATLALFQPFDLHAPTVNDEDQVPGRGAGISDLQKVLDNIATGMTNKIRVNDDLKHDGPPDLILGKAYQMQTFVEIQWGWIAAPILLLVGTVVFFVAAMIASAGRRNPEIWKSSTLPFLTALSKDLYAEGLGASLRTKSAMDNWARDVPVSLIRDDGDGTVWRLVRRQQESAKLDEEEELQTLRPP